MLHLKIMKKRRTTKSSRSASVRVPKRSLAHAFDLLAAMPADFFVDGRKEDPPRNRRASGHIAIHPQAEFAS